MFCLPQLLRSAHVSRLQSTHMRFGMRMMQAQQLSSISASIRSADVKSSLAPYFTNPHPKNNVPEGIVAKLDRRLHLCKDHPLSIIKARYK